MTAAVVLILSIATLVVVLGAYIATTRQDRRPRSAPTAAEEPIEFTVPSPAPVPEPPADYLDPRTIKVGDFIECQGTRSRVLGALHISTRQGDQWTDYLLDDGSRVYQRLSVRERAGRAPSDPAHLEVTLWTQVPTQGMVPAKSTLIMEGVEFAPLERGTVAFRSEGTTGHPDRGLLDFADYRAADGRRLSFERVQGQPWTAAYALPLPPGSIKVDRLP
jgi:hypothetical protein